MAVNYKKTGAMSPGRILKPKMAEMKTSLHANLGPFYEKNGRLGKPQFTNVKFLPSHFEEFSILTPCLAIRFPSSKI